MASESLQWAAMHATSSNAHANLLNLTLLLSLRLTIYNPCRAVPMHNHVGTAITHIESLAKSYSFDQFKFNR